jgi:hypothetical protein
MTTALGQALACLVDEVHDQRDPDTAQVWRSGRTRRRWAVARSSLLAVVVLGAVALVLWPSLGATPPPPAAPSATASAQTYPAVIPDPHFAPSALDAHRPMAATYLNGQALYAVDDRGQSWKAPVAAGWRQFAALSRDGRYATDGWAVYDFTGGRSTPLSGLHLAADDVRTGAAWSPDSRRLAIVTTGATVAVGTVDGLLASAPPLPQPSGTTVVVLQVSWLDDSTLLVTVPDAPSPEDQTHGPRVLAFSWTPGSARWSPRAVLRLPPGATVLESRGDIGASPDGQTVALPADLGTGRDAGVALLAWQLPARPGGTLQPVVASPPHPLEVDGVTWRGSDLVVVRGGVTSVASTGQVLSRATSGASRPISWRTGAFEGQPYYNTWAVWRDRLFVSTVLLGSLVLIAIGVRVARPLGRRAGILGDRYGSPFPIEARWIFSLYSGTR